MVMTGNGALGSIPETEPEKRLRLLRKAAGAENNESGEPEVVKRHINGLE